MLRKRQKKKKNRIIVLNAIQYCFSCKCAFASERFKSFKHETQVCVDETTQVEIAFSEKTRLQVVRSLCVEQCRGADTPQVQ